MTSSFLVSWVPRAELRVYAPLAWFRDSERERWSSPTVGAAVEKGGWTTLERLLAMAQRGDQRAHVIARGEQVFVCPRRLDLRALFGLLSFRHAASPLLADAVIDPADADQLAGEMSRVQARHPERRSHILSSAWHVPPEWFVAVDESERRFEQGSEGGPRLRYRTTAADAARRLHDAGQVVGHAGLGEAFGDGLETLEVWMDAFPQESLVELDYGTVSDLFPADVLADDHSAADARGALDALARGDVIKAGAAYATLSERWWSRRGQERAS